MTLALIAAGVFDLAQAGWAFMHQFSAAHETVTIVHWVVTATGGAVSARGGWHIHRFIRHHKLSSSRYPYVKRLY